MSKIKIQKIVSFSILIVMIGALLVLDFPVLRTQASDCDLLEGDDKEKCQKLEDKAEAYQKMIDLKSKQGDALSVQIQNINSQKESTRQEIEKLTSTISDLERDISEKEKEITYKKEILKGLIQVDYENNQSGVLELSFLNNDIGEIFNQSDHIEQSGTKIAELMAEVEQAKATMEKDKTEAEEKKDELEGKKNDLIAIQSQKQDLLVETQGDEAKYRKLLEKVEAQKLDLLDFSSAGNTSELVSSVGDYPKPDKKYWASTSWYYSQRDSSWGDKTIGNSNSKLKDWGCAVSSVAMVFTKLGSKINPGQLAKKSIYYYDLINWPSSWSGGIDLVSSVSHGNFSRSKVDDEIDKGNPVIVYIKRARGGGHYVVIHNKDSKDYIVHDPYFGANLYLSTSRSLVGKLGTASSTSIDQMIVYEK